MKNFLTLKFIDLFQKLFILFGCNYSEIRLILQLKITDESRRAITKYSRSKKKTTRKFNFPMDYVFLFVFGVLTATMVATSSLHNPFIGFTLLFSMNLFFLSISLFSEFTITFFDLRDSELLLPSPIEPKSLSIAKNIFLFITFFKYSLTLSISSIIFLGYYFTPLVIFPILLMLMAELLFLISATSILYGIVLKYTSGEKLKDFTSYVQVIILLIIFVLYQLFLRNSDYFLKNFDITTSIWIYFFPPSWFAALPAMAIMSYKASLLYIAIIGVVVSSSVYLIFVKVIAPFYERNLFKLKINNKTKLKKKFIIFEKFMQRFSFGNFYTFTHRMLSSDRKLKLSIYPSIVFSLFFPAMIFYTSFKKNGINISETKDYYVIYLIMMMTISFSLILLHSSYYKASWLFRYLPIKSPKPIFQGFILGSFMKFQFPLLILADLFVLKFWGLKIIPELIIFNLNCLIVILLFNVMSDRILPFSKEFIGNNSLSYKGSSYLLVSLVFFPSLVGIHYVFTLFDYGVYVLIPIQIVSSIALWKGYFNSLKWIEIKE